MNVERARRIDFWAGVPVCFLLTIACRISAALRPEREAAVPPRKILFIKLSELGAIILAYPLLARVRRQYPSAEFFFVTFDKNAGIFTLLDGVVPQKNILGIREEPLPFIRDVVKTIMRLRRENIDIVFDLEFFSRFSAIVSYLCKAGKQVGFYPYTFEGLYRGDLLTHKVPYNPLSHVTNSYVSLSYTVERAGQRTPGLDTKASPGEIVFPRYVSKQAVRARLLKKLEDRGMRLTMGKDKVFLVNPGEGVLPLREWPVENFIALSRSILETKDHAVVMIGSAPAHEKAQAMLKNIGSPRCVSLVGETGLEELMELFLISEALVSNDCGLAHLAMLSSVKKFILFGPESPQVFGPLGDNNFTFYAQWPCSPCFSALNHRKSACRDNTCLRRIKPEEVYAMIKGNL